MEAYKIKMEPGDFQVFEISERISENPSGPYTVLKIRLNNWETNHFVSYLARYLGISRKRITYAGTKDKRALTEQYFCINAERIPERINIRDCEVVERFKTDRLLNLGDLTGNRFSIKVETGIEVEKIRESFMSILNSGGFWNYFGIQRFGSIRYNTHIVGEKLVKEGFESAVKEYLADPSIDTDDYRMNLYRDWNFSRGVKEFPEHLQFERAMMYELLAGKGYGDALEAIPRSLRIMFVHAYQSILFNRILDERKRILGNPLSVEIGDFVSPVDTYWNMDENRIIEVDSFNIQRIRKMSEDGKVVVLAPLIGTNTSQQKGISGEILNSIMEREGIEFKSFNIQGKPDLSSTGNYRGIRFIPVDFQISDEKVVKFSLGRGIYATVVLDQIFEKLKSGLN